MIIYKTTNLINNKIYVGQDKYNNPKYLGSGLILRQAIKKYGRENFKKETLEHCKDFDELNDREIYWIEKLQSTVRDIGYNICFGGHNGDHMTNHPNRDEICKKISIAGKGKKKTHATRQNMSNTQMGHIVSFETRQKMIKTRKEHNVKPSKKNREITRKRLLEKNSGENNINAKTFYLISPTNEMFVVKGSLPTFCKLHNINVNVLRNYVNKGKIHETSRHNSDIRSNTVGWEIKTDINIQGKYDKYYYILTSPKNEIFYVYHGLKKFCEIHMLDYDCLILNINKGIIPQAKIKFTNNRINTYGWKIDKIL
jgi:group I intron endonuclease